MGLEDIVFSIACGLDVHFAVIVACLIRTGPKGGPQYEERSFPSTLQGLMALRDWLVSAGCQRVGMEATGVYWMPVYAALENHLSLVVGNPQHMKNLRGHKTDRKDARWIAGLARYDRIRPSFIPSQEFRDARELTRFRRKLMSTRTSVRNEVQRLLARQGITLGDVLSDVFGVSGMGILEALAKGESVIDKLPKLIHHSVKKKLKALTAALEAPLSQVPMHLLRVLLEQLEELEERIHETEKLIQEHLSPYQEKLDVLRTIPGIDLIAACIILAEISVDMSVWPTAEQLTAWAGVAPGSNETGGKQKRSAVRKGNVHLTTILVQCAMAAVKKKGCHLGGKYQRLIKQTGSKKKSQVAIARKLLVIAYKLLGSGESYQEPIARPLSGKSKKKAVQKRVQDLEALGYRVELTPLEASA